MSTLDNGNIKNTSTDFVVANPNFEGQKTDKVRGEITNTMTGQLSGHTPKPYGYYDEAGRWYEGGRGHAVNNGVPSSSVNVPASEYSVPVLNVANRFAR